MLDTKNVLTIGVAYHQITGGVAAVESVYSTFYKPFNHITTAVEAGIVRKLAIFVKAYFQFWWYMLRHKEIRIVHIHGSTDTSFWRKRIFINLAKMFGKKVIFHCHGADFHIFTTKYPKAVTKTIAKCDCIVALSDSWKTWFDQTFNHINVVVIKNVIGLPHVQKIQHNDFVLLFLGRLGQRKGIYNIIDVLIRHKDEFNGKVRLLFGGDGEVEQVKELIENNGLAGIAQFQGWVSGDKKDKLLNIADAFILPSYAEGLPISILEAMSYSLPIISTTVGGIPEIVQNGDNGYLIKPGDKDAIYNAIRSLIDNEQLRKKMGEKSFEKVQSHMPNYVEDQLRDLYNSLL